MSKEKIIVEILKRFKLDSNAIKKMEEYEYELIYKSFPKVPPEIINDAIDAYNNNNFKVRIVRTSFH